MDELTLHRKRRLKTLLESPRFEGSQLALANAIGRSEGRVSQLLDPKHSFGERAARAIAEELGLSERHFEVGYGADAGAKSGNGTNTTRPSEGVAHLMTLDAITVPQTTKWGDVMAWKEIPERFTVAMPDGSLAGFIDKGTELVFERDLRAQAGKTVLIEDKDGNRFIRRYAEVRGDHWRATSSGPGFEPLDSIEHGLKVLAVMRWREG